MPYSVISYEPASIKKDDVEKAVLKLVGVEKEKIRQYIWTKNEKGKTVIDEDEKGNKKYDEVEGFCLYFKYKNKNNKWTGIVEPVELKEGGLGNTYKTCLRLDLPLPKVFSSRSALVGFLQLVEIAEKPSELAESDLLADIDDYSDIDESSLLEDSEDSEEALKTSETPDYDEIRESILEFKNKMFLAPYYLNSKGYTQLQKNFELWELVNK